MIPPFGELHPQAHRRHLEAYQRHYSFWFHNNALEKWRKWLTLAKTSDGMWHQRPDAYIAHLVQNEILNRRTIPEYLNLLKALGSQHRHLRRLTADLVIIVLQSGAVDDAEDRKAAVECGDAGKVVTFSASGQ